MIIGYVHACMGVAALIDTMMANQSGKNPHRVPTIIGHEAAQAVNSSDMPIYGDNHPQTSYV